MADYPIVYIRGYAMTPQEVDTTFNMPYYGFNLGSSVIRQARDEKPVMRIFESPVVRLIKEEGYHDSFNKYVSASNEPIPDSVLNDKMEWRKTLWIFRFYDRESSLFQGKRVKIEDYAESLALFLDGVRKACGNPDGFKVNLVAHSMGGLIARCYLQNKTFFQRPALNSTNPVAINKLFTYGTPHRGITFRQGLGWIEDLRDLVGTYGADTFGEKRIREFLSLDDQEDLRNFHPVRNDLTVERTFCIVGTNYEDYVVWVSKKAVGPGSDGLVATENAYMKGAPRAYIHRAHFGPYGIVNSEEGYQNLTRFLFGNIRFEVILDPLNVVKHLPGVKRDVDLDYLQVEVDVVIRGLPNYIQTRRENSQSSITIKMIRNPAGPGFVQEDNKATHLFTGYLRNNKRMSGDPFMHWAIQLRVEPHYRYEHGIRTSRFEGEAILNDRLHVGIRYEPLELKYRWSTKSTFTTQPVTPGQDVALPLASDALKYIENGSLRMRLTPWD